MAASACGHAVQHVRAPEFTGTSARGAAKIPSTPARPDIQQILNAVYAGEGDLEAKRLRAQLDADPANTDARLALARHYKVKGFPDVALEHGRIACERAPESVEAHIALARMLRDEHRPAEGASVLSGFTSRRDDDVRAWAWLGVLEDEAGNPRAGETAHRRALALAPGRDDLLNNLGYCLLQQGRKSEAAEVFHSALKINPQSAIVRNNLGFAEAENAREAVLEWQSILGPAAAHNNLAASLIETGRYADARREIQTALNFDARYAPALNNLRLLSELDGKPAESAPPAGPAKNWTARVGERWRHLWGGAERTPASRESGSPVASR